MSYKDELLEIASQDPDAEEAISEQLKFETIGDKLVKWYKGAEMGAEEVGRAITTAYMNAPRVVEDKYSVDWEGYDLPPIYEATGGEEGKATHYNEIEQQMADYLERATNNVRQETLRPVATIAATFGGEVGLAMLAPFMLQDIGKAIDDEDYIGAAKTAAMLASPGLSRVGGLTSTANSVVGLGLMADMAVGTSQQLGDKNFQAYANYDPIGAIGNTGANLVPMLHPAIQGVKGARKMYLKTKEKLTDAQAEAKIEKEMTPTEVLAEKPVEENKVEEKPAFVPKEEKTVSDKIDMGSNKKVQENVKTIEEKYREKQQWDEIDKQVMTNGVDEPYQTRDAQDNVVTITPQAVPERGFWSRLWRGSTRETVKVKDIHDAANEITPITYGDTGGDALGWYHNIGQGVRVQRHQWFETIAHEVGHYIDRELMQLGGFDQELVGNAKRRWRHGQYGDPTDPANDPAYRREGIADFSVVWMLNHEQARQIYPQYCAAFERALEANPQLRRQTETLSELIRRWYTQTDVQRGVGSSEYAGDGKATIRKNGVRGVLGEKFRGAGEVVDRINTEALDINAPLRRAIEQVEDKLGFHLNLEENPADLIHHATKEIPARIALFLGENRNITTRDAIRVLSEVYNVDLREVTMGDVYERLGELRDLPHVQTWMRENGLTDTHTGLAEYMKALHSLEIINEHTNDYTTTGSIQRHQNIVNNAPPEFMEIANMLSDYNYNMLNLAMRFGLTDAATVARFRSRYPHYVPFMRSFAEEGIVSSNNGQGNGGTFANLDSLYHALSEHGSDRTTLDPLVQMQLQTARIISRGQKNLVAQQTAHLANITGGHNLVMDITAEGTDFPIGREHGTFEVWENGQRHVYKATNPVIYQVLAMPPDVAALGNTMLGGFLRSTATGLRMGATQTIPFTIWNGIRDSLTAAVTTKTVSLREFYKANPIYFLLNGVVKQAVGGENFISHFMDRHNITPGFRNYCREVNAKYEVSGAKYATRYRNAEQLGHQRITETELHGTHDVYETARTTKHYAKEAWDVVYAIATAGKAGEVVENAPRFTEFERTLRQGGSLMEAADNAFNITVDFDRHGNMSSLTQYTAFYNAAVQGNAKLVRDFLQRPETCVPYALINLTLPAIVAWSYNKDKDWYISMPVEEKLKNLHIELPNGNIMRIPLPEILGIIAGGLPGQLLDFHYRNDKEDNLNVAADSIIGMAVQNPLGFTGVIPILEWVTDYSFFRGRQLTPDNLKNLPANMQYTPYTSEVAKSIGNVMYDVLPRGHKGVASPIRIDNAMRGYGGSMASTILGAIDALTTNKAPARKKTEWMRFTYTPGTSYSRETIDFQNLWKEEEAQYKATKKKSKTYQQLAPHNNAIKKLRQEFNAKYLNPKGSGYGLSSEEKRKAQDIRDAKINQHARQALRKTGRKYFNNVNN